MTGLTTVYHLHSKTAATRAANMNTIDHLITHLEAWLDASPAHLVALLSIGAVTFGLWVIGHQLGVL